MIIVGIHSELRINRSEMLSAHLLFIAYGIFLSKLFFTSFNFANENWMSHKHIRKSYIFEPSLRWMVGWHWLTDILCNNTLALLTADCLMFVFWFYFWSILNVKQNTNATNHRTRFEFRTVFRLVNIEWKIIGFCDK